MQARRQVRGVLFIDYVKILRWHGVDAARPHLQPDDLPFLAQRLDPQAWYPMETFERLGLAILEVVVGTETDVIRLWGRSMTEGMIRSFADLDTPERPQESITRFAARLGALFDFDAVRLLSVRRERLEVRVAYGMSPRAEAAATWQAMGFFEELITTNGGQSVRGALTGSGFVLEWSQPGQEPPPPSARPRVLVVDDERLVLRAVARSLRTIAEVTTAGSAAEALARLEAEPYDTVVSDFHLGPQGDGLDLLRQIQQRWPQVRRVLHSGDPPRAAQAAVKTGVVHEVLVKPAPLDELRRAVTARTA